jgi:hypothetical protein
LEKDLQMSNNNATVYTNGGTTGVSFGTEADFEADITGYDALNGDTGSGRVTVGIEGEIIQESLGAKRVNVGQEIQDQRANAASILDTARTPWGTRPSQLTKGSIVMVHGTETSLGAAVQMGLVRQDSQGNFVETAQGQQPQQNQQAQPQRSEQAADSADFMPIPQANMEALNAAIEPIPQTMYESVVAQYLQGGMDSINSKAIAATLGMDESDVRERITLAANVFQVHAKQGLKGVVADPDGALEWMATERPKDFARAMAQVVHGHNVGELRSLGLQYVKATNPDASTLRNAGFETSTAKDGTEMVRIQGQWMSVRAAVHAGLI